MAWSIRQKVGFHRRPGTVATAGSGPASTTPAARRSALWKLRQRGRPDRPSVSSQFVGGSNGSGELDGEADRYL